MTRTTELTPLLKSLKLGALASTLPERIALARREQLDYASFLEIILSDEVNRRAHRRTELRLHNAGFEETCRLEDFDWSAWPWTAAWDAVFSLEFLDRHEHVLLVGPAVSARASSEALGYGRPRRILRALQPRRRLLQGPDPGQSRQLGGPRLPVFPHARPASSMTWVA